MSEEAKKTEASRLVNEVWQSCWNDTRPFDEVSHISYADETVLTDIPYNLLDLLNTPVPNQSSR